MEFKSFNGNLEAEHNLVQRDTKTPQLGFQGVLLRLQNVLIVLLSGSFPPKL